MATPDSYRDKGLKRLEKNLLNLRENKNLNT